MNISENPKTKKKKRIHYYLLIDDKSHLIPCDSAARSFLQQIDLDTLSNHILELQFHTATILSTIILNNISYSLKVVPISDSDIDTSSLRRSLSSNITHIVLIQDQFLFADLLHSIGMYPSHSKEFENIIMDYDDPIYINHANGDPIYINHRYWEISGLSPDILYGSNTVVDDDKFFEPVVTPSVMKRKAELTTFQHLKTGHDIITTGIPIYVSNGNYNLVLFLVSPLDDKEILSSHIVSMHQAVTSQVKEGKFGETTNIEIIAESPIMKNCLQDAMKIAAYDVPCLLLGSSGSGKEVFASLIHNTSRRNTQPFVKLNCSALSPTLLESELFGYEPNSFTGASARGKKGFFETANHGTLLLDEIGDMPLDSQAKLLRALETGEIYRVGSVSPIKTDVRIIASTNKNLRSMAQKGTFRSDLFYRLNVASISLPDLKDRGEDITLFINHFSHLFNRKYSTNKQFSADIISALKRYPWPGNVRELRNAVERLTLLCSNTILTSDDIAYADIENYEEMLPEISVRGIPRLEDAVDSVEKLLVSRALSLTGNTRRAAEILDVSQSTIMRKIKKYNLQNDPRWSCDDL